MSDDALDLLLVDDEPDMVRGLGRILRSRGFHVDVAHSGDEAIEKAKVLQPDGVLMDIRMPGMNGVEAYRHIRRECPQAFVVFMTAHSELADEARDEGAVDVLSKPLEVDQLCPLLEHAAIRRPILIVDDDLDFCRSLARSLSRQEFDVRLATTAAEAIRVFEKSPRALVLLDMRLPDQSGLDVLDRLKELNEKALVIPMSGDPEMQETMEERRTGSGSAYLTKPFEMGKLLALVEVMSTRRKAR